jgi:hypothetical protein
MQVFSVLGPWEEVALRVLWFPNFAKTSIEFLSMEEESSTIEYPRCNRRKE